MNTIAQSKIFILVLFLLGFSNCNKKKMENCDKPLEIISYFNKNFNKYSVTASGIKILGPFKSNPEHTDNYADLMISRAGENLDMASIISHDLNNAIEQGFTVKSVISKNETFCEMKLSKLHNKVEREYGVSVFVHFWKNPNELGSDSMYVVRNYSYMKYPELHPDNPNR